MLLFLDAEAVEMKSYDAVIIGAGHNGLVCAAYLAKAGIKTCLIERQPFVGGAAITREIWPGYKVSVASYWMSLLQPKIMLDLDLLNNGVEVSLRMRRVPDGVSGQRTFAAGWVRSSWNIKPLTSNRSP